MISDYERLEVVQKRKLTSCLEVMVLVASLQSEGHLRLAELIARKGHKGVDNAIFLAKELGEVKRKVECAQKLRVELLTEARANPCINGCN